LYRKTVESVKRKEEDVRIEVRRSITRARYSKTKQITKQVSKSPERDLARE